MNKLKVSARLGLGFGLVIVLMLVVTATALWHLKNNDALTTRMVHQTMVKERLIGEWHNKTEVNGIRTIAAANTADQERIRIFQERIKATSARISEIQKKLDEMPQDAEEKQMLVRIAEKRSLYLAERDATFAEKKAGNEDAVKRISVERLEPALDAYLATINELTGYQAKQIGSMRGNVLDNSHDAQMAVLLFSGLTLLAAIGAATYIARGLLLQLGCEPAQAVGIADRIAQGDLAVDIVMRQRDQSSILHATAKMRDSLSVLVSRIRAGSEQIATASSQIASGNMDLSARTEQQAASLEETVSSMEQLTATVRQNTDNALQGRQLAASASEVARRGGEVVSNVVETMKDINASSHQITDIIGVIDSIAFQTNILALNAAVEAARAGDQGRGFAVVAAEVRSLAQRSASASKQIKELIGNSVSRANDGAVLVERAGAAMGEIVASVQKVADIMADISAASAEQSNGIELVNKAIAQMDQVTQQNAALVEQAAAAACSMQEQADKLTQTVSVFRVKS